MRHVSRLSLSLLGGLAATVLVVGCRSGPQVSPHDTAATPGGPRVDPDPGEGRRRPVPLPPVYMDIATDSGHRLQMVTPLYWQFSGREHRHHHFVPLLSINVDDGSDASWGYVLNWVWRDRPDSGFRTFFPVYWHTRSGASQTIIAGPLYHHRDTGPTPRERTILFPWLYSREKDHTGYSYWGVLGRLVGYEKQLFEGEERRRLWLFFVFRVNVS